MPDGLFIFFAALTLGAALLLVLSLWLKSEMSRDSLIKVPSQHLLV